MGLGVLQGGWCFLLAASDLRCNWKFWGYLLQWEQSLSWVWRLRWGLGWGGHLDEAVGPGCSSAWQSVRVSRAALLISRQSRPVPNKPCLLDTPSSEVGYHQPMLLVNRHLGRGLSDEGRDPEVPAGPLGCLPWVTLLPVTTPCPASFLLVTFSPEEALQSFSVVKPLRLAPSPGVLAFWADASGLFLLHSLLSLGLGLSLHPQPTCEPPWPSHHLFCC